MRERASELRFLAERCGAESLDTRDRKRIAEILTALAQEQENRDEWTQRMYAACAVGGNGPLAKYLR